MGSKRFFDGLYGIVLDVYKACGQRGIGQLIFFLACSRKGGHSAAVEGILGGDNFISVLAACVKIFAGQLKSALVGFGAAVAEKAFIAAR